MLDAKLAGVLVCRMEYSCVVFLEQCQVATVHWALFVNSRHKNFQVAGLDAFLYSHLHRMNAHTTTNLYGWNYKAILLANVTINLWWSRGTEIPSRSEESAHHPIVPIMVVSLFHWNAVSTIWFANIGWLQNGGQKSPSPLVALFRQQFDQSDSWGLIDSFFQHPLYSCWS